MLSLLRYLWSNYKNYFVLVLFVSLSITLLSVNDTVRVKNFRSFSFGLFSLTTGWLSNVFNGKDLEAENSELREKNARLMIEVNKLMEYKRISTDIEKLQKVADTSGYELIFSRITYKAYSGTQLNINVKYGRKNGIEPGMPAITHAGLVGIVKETGEDYSIIRTIKNSNLRLVIKNSGDGSQGILRWSGSDLVVTNLPKTAIVNIGDLFVTSDVSTIIDLPLSIGKVKRVLNPEEGIFNDILLEPSVEVDKIDYVFIVKHVPSKIKHNIELNFYRNK